MRPSNLNKEFDEYGVYLYKKLDNIDKEIKVCGTAKDKSFFYDFKNIELSDEIKLIEQDLTDLARCSGDVVRLSFKDNRHIIGIYPKGEVDIKEIFTSLTSTRGLYFDDDIPTIECGENTLIASLISSDYPIFYIIIKTKTGIIASITPLEYIEDCVSYINLFLV